ncbi:Amyrin synthase LUP2, partial [Striga hermonthica]
MWKLKIAEGHGPYLYSTNNFVGRQIWEYEPNEGTPDEREAFRKACKQFDENRKKGFHSCGDLFMRMQVLGVYDWDGCNPLPPEFWLFPSFFPYHPAKMWCYCRTTYMPMSYLYGRKYHGPITDLVLSLRDEIHVKPYDLIDWNKARHDCCKDDLYYPHTFVQDLLWDSLNYFTEPVMRRWPLNKIRQKAMDKAIKYMRYGAEESRYITIGCVEKSLQMMCWWAHNPNGTEFKHHLARVPDYLWLAEDGMKMQSFGSQLWDSTLATQAVISTGMVEEYGDCLKKAHFFIKESQIKENPIGDYKGMYRHFTKGAWTFSDQDQGWVVSDCTAEALKCLLLLSQMPAEISGEKPDVERLYEAVNVLLYLQSPLSGGFAIWEPPIPQPYLQ